VGVGYASTDGPSWEVFTDRTGEGPRKGYGRESYEATLRHLRRRGDVKVRVRPPGAELIVEKTLIERRPW
jgi:hypothetical protein